MMTMKDDVALVRSKAKTAASMRELLPDLEALFQNHGDELAELTASCRFRISDSGQSFSAKLVRGIYTPLPEDAPVDVCISAKDADFLGLLSGSLNPVKAMLFGKIKVQGDLKLLSPLTRFL